MGPQWQHHVTVMVVTEVLSSNVFPFLLQLLEVTFLGDFFFLHEVWEGLTVPSTPHTIICMHMCMRACW